MYLACSLWLAFTVIEKASVDVWVGRSHNLDCSSFFSFWPSGVKDCREQVKHLQSMDWSKGQPTGNHHFSHS